MKLQPWDDILRYYDPNEMWSSWKALFFSVINRHAPTKKKRLKNKASPWLTIELKKLMNERDNFKRTAIKSNSTEDWKRYREMKNSINNRIKRAKKDYYNKKFSACSNNPKEMWKTINNILCRQAKPGNTISCIKTQNTNIYEYKELAEKFNEYFTEIGPQLASKLSPLESSDVIDFRDYIPTVQSAFRLQPVTENIVYNIMTKMSPNKATGLDEIPSKLLIDAAPAIVQSVTKIINQSIKTSIFPSQWKFAKVTPIHKSKEKDLLNNYRPISVISAVAKVFERVVYNQLYKYLDENNLLHLNQSGFRPKHSTAFALFDATIEWLKNLDKGRVTSAFFLDLAKAFDTVDHTILLSKLSIYGVDERSVLWFKSYLSDRQQICLVNQHQSSPRQIICGVPQGSILGPLLFLIYINDLPNCLSYSTPRMYADDTNLSTCHENFNT